MTYIVNSFPGAGHRHHPSAQFENAVDALQWAGELVKRGMRLVRIRDKSTGEVFEAAALRKRLAAEPPA
ncbi:MAG: hypothetical protein ABW199_01815 [Caulobacterales bacterium]